MNFISVAASDPIDLAWMQGAVLLFVFSFNSLSLSLSLSHPNLKKKKIEACADEGIGNVPLAIADLEFSMRLAHSLAVDFCTLCCWGTIFEASQARTVPSAHKLLVALRSSGHKLLS